MCKKGYICNPTKYVCENDKYLNSAADDSNIKFDEIIETKSA